MLAAFPQELRDTYLTTVVEQVILSMEWFYTVSAIVIMGIFLNLSELFTKVYVEQI